MVAEASLPTPTFYVGEEALERVTISLFGTDPLADDHDLSACVRNIQRAKTQWAAVLQVPEARGVSKEIVARLYLVIVSTVLLYGK
jgi:hypothetical protein